MEGLDSVEVAPAKQEGDGGSSYAAEEQLWRHEFFRDCMAPKQASFKVPTHSDLHTGLHCRAESGLTQFSLMLNK